MRLISLQAKSYRVHDEVSITFDRARTVIRGPNETGKSTLLEAIQRALFLKSSVTGQLQRSMRSTLYGGQPEVELTFESVGETYTVHKRFSGTSGTTTLRRHGGNSWQDSEAEQLLAEIVGTDVSGQRINEERIREPWAHLLVLQGESGLDPTAYANRHRTDLLSRFQESGGAIVQESELDAAIVAGVASLRAEFFTAKGKELKNSPLGRLRTAIEEAKSDHARAETNLQAIERAMDDYDRALRDIESIEASMTELEVDQQSCHDKLAEASELERNRNKQAEKLASAQREVTRLEQLSKNIRELNENIASCDAELAPKEKQLTEIDSLRKFKQSELDRVEEECESAAKAAAKARSALDLINSFRQKSALMEARKQLEVRRDRVATARQEQEQCRQKLARLPAIDDAALEKLKAAADTRSRAEAALTAISAGLEVLEAGIPVRLDGEVLSAGEKRLLTSPVEVEIGDAVKLSLTPGGGTNLEQASEVARSARASLERNLEELRIDSVRKAEQTAAERRALAQTLEQLASRLDDDNVDSLDAELEENSERLVQAAASIAHLREHNPEFVPPDNDKESQGLLNAAEKSRKAAEQSEESAKEERKQLLASHSELAGQRQACDTEIRAIAARRDELRGRLDALRSQQDDGSDLETQLTEYRAAAKAEQGALDTITRDLESLLPTQLELDQDRLERAIEAAQKRLQTARSDRDVAKGALSGNSSVDPKEYLERTTAELIRLNEELNRHELQAQAISLLGRLFTEEQHRLASEYTAPLIEKASEYLRCVLGPLANVRLDLADSEFTALGLDREHSGLGTFAFDFLSGGTREQVAAALRLSVAEILASGHDGVLPVVFDDAFTNSDPERTRSIQRMLDLAANRGLQVVVLTCSESDYAGLGAAEVVLDRPRTAAKPAKYSESVVSASPEREQQFLEALGQADGKSGNQKLRERLGWDESTYDIVKEALLESGRVKAGKGRGGSVLLED